MNIKAPLILIVDDSDLTRASLTKLFYEYNCKVESCEDGLYGIQKALSSKPDIIILDILMPNIDGIKMLQIKKVIDELKNIPVIILSGNVNKSNMLAAFENGADKVIVKPFKIDDLINAVSELLGFKLERKVTDIILADKSNDSTFYDIQNVFFDAFPEQKRIIIESVSNRDKKKLKTVSHQIKGLGTTIGLPQVSDICRNLEFNLSSDKIDWDFIINQCERLFTIVSKAQLEQKVVK